MEIRLRVEMPSPTARSSAVVLGSLAVMHDGLRLMLEGGVEDYARRLGEAIIEGTDLKIQGTLEMVELLREVGDAAVSRHLWGLLPEGADLLLAQAILRMRPPGDDLRLVSLRAGSLEAVLEDQLEHVGGLFRSLLKSANSILRGGEAREFKDTLRQVAARSQESDAGLVGAGVVILGGQNLKSSYVAREVTRIRVE